MALVKRIELMMPRNGVNDFAHAMAAVKIHRSQ
jgi:hypothetical protein